MKVQTTAAGVAILLVANDTVIAVLGNPLQAVAAAVCTASIAAVIAALVARPRS